MLRFDHTPSWYSVLLIVYSAAVIGFGGAANAADPSSEDPAASENAAADANAVQSDARSQARGLPLLFSNEKSGRCIGVDHAGTHHGAYIKQFTCVGNDDQYWTPEFVDTNNEYFVLRNLKSERAPTSDCLTVTIRQISNGSLDRKMQTQRASAISRASFASVSFTRAWTTGRS
jgi:hypothetical protein